MDVTNNESLALHLRSLCRKLDSNRIVPNLFLKKYIIIDLGNIHDFLPYYDNNNILHEYNVIAFADHHFNGYGINPTCKRKVGLYVSGASKNAADVTMIWFIARMSIEPCFFYVITKDKGFRELQNLCVENGSECVFYENTKAFFDHLNKI